MPPDHPDNEVFLLIRCAEGDVKAFNEIFTHHYKQVYGLSLLLSKSPELAEDLTQEIFTKIWEKREQLREVRQFRPYLNTVIRNHVRDFLKKKVFTPANAGYLENFFTEASGNAENILATKEMESRLQEAIQSLPPQAREVFMLSRHENLSHRQIAQRLNISETTTKSHIARALTGIRDYLRVYYPHLFPTLWLFFLNFFSK